MSMSERFHNLVESVYTPDLFTNEPAGRETLTMAQRKVQALDTFKNTPEYQSFKKVIDDTLRQLDEIANSTRTPSQKNTNFQNLGHGLWQPINLDITSRFGAFQADLYQQACPDADRLVRMHAFAQQKPRLVTPDGEANARACIKDLSEKLHVCGPGIVQHFDEAVNTVRQSTFTPSLPERFEALRIQIARNVITEFVRNNPEPLGHGIGNEIHKVAAWQNFFSLSMVLPPVADIFASTRYIGNQDDQRKLTTQLNSLQTLSSVSKVMATQILEEAHDLWNKARANGETDISRGCMAIIEKISNKHGPVEPHAIFQINENGMPCKLHDNPTLMALSIMRKLGTARGINTCPEYHNYNHFTHQSGRHVLSLKNAGNLSWLEASPLPGSAGETEQKLLSSQHLSTEQIRELVDALIHCSSDNLYIRTAMHELLRNDWGAYLPNCRIHDFDPAARDDVFINLAMGFSKRLQLGPIDVGLNYLPVLLKAMDSLHGSSVLGHYTNSEICQMLDYANDFDKIFCNHESALRVVERVDNITRLQPSNVKLELYKAALRFNYINETNALAMAPINNPAFTAENPAYSRAYVQLLSRRLPHLLNIALCGNIQTIRRPMVALNLFQACQSFDFDEAARDNALKRLVQRDDDGFVLTVLHNLSAHDVPLRALEDPDVIQDLRSRHMDRSADFLRAKIALQPSLSC